MCAQFHPSEDLIVSASLDQSVRVWDISGKLDCQLLLPLIVLVEMISVLIVSISANLYCQKMFQCLHICVAV